MRVKWLKHGDKNTHFFHGIVARRSIQRGIHHLSIDGDLSSYLSLIKDHILGFYDSSFASENNLRDFSSIAVVIPSLVTVFDNMSLLSITTYLDIKNVVFELDSHISLGPDSFTGFFYKTCWDCVGVMFVRQSSIFFITGHISSRLNFIYMVLIPKVEDADLVDRFQPIVIGNFLFKVVIKILVDQLGGIVARIIDYASFRLC